MSGYAVCLYPDGSAKPIELDGTIESYQNAIGGYIEVVPLPVPGVIFLVDGAGKFKDLKPNGLATYLSQIREDVIVGRALLVNTSGEEFRLLSEPAAKALAKGLSHCCPFCGGKLRKREGNDSWPLYEAPCCDGCNFTHVLPARLAMMREGKK